MSERYYKKYPQFSKFAKEVSKIDFYNSNDYKHTGREHHYNQLRLSLKFFEGEIKNQIDDLVMKYFKFDNVLFSIIETATNKSISQIHTDTNYKKSKVFQRYCNLAIPIQGDLQGRKTIWPNLDEEDAIYCFKNSFVDDNSLPKYLNSENWNGFVEHALYRPVLLNTGLPHAAIGNSKTLFAYITLVNKSYEECVALYDSISNSATT
jgi:hypothetical protein